jgi:DnaK suppressor protein
MNDELGEIQHGDFERRLRDLQRELEDLLDVTADDARPVQLKDNKGRLSRMDEMHNQSILLANRNLMRTRLQRVRAARRRLDEGNFGFCADCDEMIALPRLQAWPEATLCLGCQSAREAR